MERAVGLRTRITRIVTGILVTIITTRNMEKVSLIGKVVTTIRASTSMI